MTSTPVRTLLNNAILAAVKEVSALGDNVFLDPSRGLREELVGSPGVSYANVMTMPENASKVDLYKEGSFEFEVHTWTKSDTDDAARETCIDINAQIQMKLLPKDSGPRAYCWYLEELDSGSDDILFFGEGLCVAINRYLVKYRHVYANPYLLNP